MSCSGQTHSREVTIPNPEGLHSRPVMLFVDTASTFSSVVTVRNISRNGERVDAKSAMQMMLLEGTQGCILGLEADGSDAQEAVETLAKLVESGFQVDGRL